MFTLVVLVFEVAPCCSGSCDVPSVPCDIASVSCDVASVSCDIVPGLHDFDGCGSMPSKCSC